MRKILLLLLDISIITAAFILAVILRFGTLREAVHNQWAAHAFLVVLTPIIFYLYDLYNHLLYCQRIRVFYRIVNALIVLLFAYVSVGFITKFMFLIESRAFTALFFCIAFILFFFIRVILARNLLELYFHIFKHRILCRFVGPPQYFEDLHEILMKNCVTGLNLINTNENGNGDNGLKDVFLYSETNDYAALYEEIKRNIYSSRRLHVISPMLDQLRLNWEWMRFDNKPIYTFNPRRANISRDLIRRGLDVIGSTVGLIILSPILLLVSLAIILTSKGPIIYKQTRCGKNNKPFTFYKFRSMYLHVKTDVELEAESSIYLNISMRKDTSMNNGYITPVGRIIRKTSIDELPQLVNVLKGEMSLIGPRPHRPHEVKCYKEWHKDRLNVRQGLTGLWQIYGRGEMPCDKSIFLDLIYVFNRSISLDMRLLLQTVPAVILGRGAC